MCQLANEGMVKKIGLQFRPSIKLMLTIACLVTKAKTLREACSIEVAHECRMPGCAPIDFCQLQNESVSVHVCYMCV